MIKKYIILILAILTTQFLAMTSLAVVYYLPLSENRQQLVITNYSSAEEMVWIQLKNSTSFEELSYHVPAQSTLTLQESDFLPAGLEYTVKSDSNLILILRKSQDSAAMTATPQVSPYVLYSFKNKVPENLQVWIQNQNLTRQNIRVRYLSAQKSFLGQVSINSKDYFQSSHHQLQPPPDCRFIELIGEGRLNSQLQSPQKWIIGEELLIPKIKVPEHKVYFLLTNSVQSDSFIVALEEPHWIEKARALIRGPNNYLTLFGRIRADQNSWNRPLLSKNKTSWSWTVAEVTNFADIGSDSCNGSPSMVEEQLPMWLQAENSKICFWSYRVTKELNKEEVEYGRLFSNDQKGHK